MFTIESDIDEVIAGLERAQGQIMEVPTSVLRPELYLDDLKSVAETVLDQLTQEHEKFAIPVLVESITGWVAANSTIFEMIHTGTEGGLDGFQPGDLGFQRLEPLQDLIEEWVRLYKDKTQQDIEQYEDDEELARHIIGTIQNDPGAWTGSTDPEGLFPFLRAQNPEAFNQVFGLTGLPDLKATELLSAVLAAWHEFMGLRLTEQALQQISSALG